MDSRYVHAFVVKIWLERREIAGAPAEWRGRIDHVQSGGRRYIRDLSDIMRFIQSFLESAESNLAESDTDMPPGPL